MREQLISFETAKLAKGKGFNEREHWFYKVKSENDIELYGCTKKQLVGFKGYNPIYNKVNDYHTNKEKDNAKLYRCSAPTQSLLQKWLMEKYRIFININYDGNDEVFRVEIIKQNNDRSRKVFYLKEENIIMMFHSYEDALEISLQEGLKLI